MANRFPPNLDDGEHWLPSDIFINDVVLPSRPNSISSNYCPNLLSCMEDVAALSLLNNLNRHSLTPFSRPISKLPSTSQSVKMAVRDHFPAGYLGFKGGAGELSQRLHGHGTDSLSNRSEPFYDFQKVQPQLQVDSYLQETWPRVLQRQRNHVQNRMYPFKGSGLGFRGGGVRESGGTGVFHPRIVNPTTIASSGGSDAKRKQSIRSRQQTEIQMGQQRNSMRRVVVNKQEDCHYHLPPEMGLPHDWTY